MNTSSTAAGAETVIVQKITVTVQKKVIVTVVYCVFVDAYVCFCVCMAVYGSSYL